IPVGLASLTLMTAANSTIQMSVDPVMRGRVMSLYMVVFMGSNPIGAPVIGWVAEEFGARWSIGVGAIASLLVAGAAALWAQRAWDVEVRYRLLSRPHVSVRHRGEDDDEHDPRTRTREDTARRIGAQQATDSTTAA